MHDRPVAGPYVVTDPKPGLAAAFGTLWAAVVRSGGAVGFPADAAERDIRAAAAAAIDDVAAGRMQLLALGEPADLVGTVFVRRGAGPVLAHRAELVRLMVRPDRQGGGLGSWLLDAAVAHAGAAGFRQLLISTRGGTALPGYYAARGWTQVGLFPGALLVGDELRDEHWFQLRLDT